MTSTNNRSSGNNKGGRLRRSFTVLARYLCALMYGITRLRQPLAITSPSELTSHINHHARIMIARCIDQDYLPLQRPPALPYVIITAMLWQHSLHLWRRMSSAEEFVQLVAQVEAIWRKNALHELAPDSLVNVQQTMEQLAAVLNLPGKGDLYTSSHNLANYLQHYYPDSCSTATISVLVREYIHQWQAKVSSHNLVAILLLRAKRDRRVKDR